MNAKTKFLTMPFPTFNTERNYIEYVRSQLELAQEIEKIHSFKFLFKVGENWYFLAFALELGTSYGQGQSLTLMRGDDAQKLKSASHLTIVQKMRAMEDFGYDFYSIQFPAEDDINVLFQTIESKYIDLSGFKLANQQQVFASASEFLSRFTVRKLSSTTFAIFCEGKVQHFTIKELYNRFTVRPSLIIVKKNDSNIVTENFVTEDKGAIEQIFDYLTFAEYLQNTNNEKFLEAKRKIDIILPR